MHYAKWTAKARALLGTMPDKQLARRLRRTKAAVTFMRKKLGIACFHGYKPWHAAELDLLRSISMADFPSRVAGLAARFKRSPGAIRAAHRRVLGLWFDSKAALARRSAAA